MLRRIVGICFLLLAQSVSADDMRPASLTISAVDATRFAVSWKVPAQNNKRLGLDVLFGPDVRSVSTRGSLFTNDAYVEQWEIERDAGLPGMTFSIDGLTTNAADVLVRIIDADGRTLTTLLNADTQAYTVPTTAQGSSTALTYTLLGVEHILEGLDHLLFVLCLMFIARGGKRLVWCITGFTLAHSLTLVAATLELVYVPIAPVEAAIALSIVFLAAEILKNRSGSLSLRYPVAVSSSFGLLHGFGFASVLADIGLPPNETVWALLFFNLGVEIGQLLFVAALFVLWFLLRKLLTQLSIDMLRAPLGYLCGVVATIWLLQRLAAF